MMTNESLMKMAVKMDATMDVTISMSNQGEC
jgi:hypothetical protein